MKKPIYLDHAATSAPKPERVARRVRDYLLNEGISAGRGGYERAMQVGREIENGRARLANLLNAESASRIVFTGGGTEALNLALLGFLGEGDHVVISTLEHNSVLRPLNMLETKRGVRLSYVHPDEQGIVAAEKLIAACRPETKLICCLHASNVTGIIQPIEELCRLARRLNVSTLIDAAQTVGHLPIDLQKIDCDFLAAPCHKGLQAPLGTGFLYLRPGMEQHVLPLQFGGTGTQSELATQPVELPVRYESGSLAVPALLGLSAALSEISNESIREDFDKRKRLSKKCMEELAEIESVIIYPQFYSKDNRIDVISFNLRNQDPRIVGTILDQHFQIEVRTGFHCAPLVHEDLGTTELGGTIRVSLGSTTTEEEIETFLDAIRQIAGA
ncbi:aminotransferase class V-fold PLP-dependent enzyme [Rubinisphaera italica]|uniref:cysteine desulfurase n=1 Tax=Rubinisphaera italica TaxID=2527969 RepID=A0A5C5XKM8_9PLAN|nr:aminotransferase class V-fold PLP-dependent enzyme [Rubinisphaera italica]TWT63258.1 putative cysteine desulfurase [Rubinisphaera italica]